VLTALLLVLSASPKLAAPGFTCTGVNAGICDAYLEHFVANLTAKGVTVMTKSNVAEVMGIERQRQLLGCNDEKTAACLTELVGALGVATLLSGTVAKLESGYVATLKLIDGQDGTTRWSATARVDDERAFFGFLDVQSQRLVDHLIPPAPPTPFIRFVPGIGGAALVVTGIGLQLAAAGDAATLEKHIAGTTRLEATEIDRLLKEGSGFQVLAAVSIGVGVAAIAGSVLWVMLGEKPAATVALVPLRSGAAAMLSWELP